MSVRRGAARLAAVIALLAGLLAMGAAPAWAADDRVNLAVPGSFTAGGSPGSVTVFVTKRSDGCVDVRTALGVRLTGLSPSQLRVQVSDDGQWRPVGVSGAGDGVVVTERVAPDRDKLCKRRSVALRYRVTFLDGAPGGTADISAAALTADGDVLGRATVRREVRGGSARPSPSRTPSPSPTSEPTEAAETTPPTQPAVPLTPAKQDGGGLGMGALVIALGVAMVGIGIGLIVYLVRGNRADRDDPGAGGHPYGGPPPPPPAPGGGDHTPTLILPKLPG